MVQHSIDDTAPYNTMKPYRIASYIIATPLHGRFISTVALCMYVCVLVIGSMQRCVMRRVHALTQMPTSDACDSQSRRLEIRDEGALLYCAEYAKTHTHASSAGSQVSLLSAPGEKCV